MPMSSKDWLWIASGAALALIGVSLVPDDEEPGDAPDAGTPEGEVQTQVQESIVARTEEVILKAADAVTTTGIKAEQAVAKVAQQAREKVVTALQQLATDAGKLAFKAVLPDRAGPYADMILNASQQTGVSPFLIFAVGDRETSWGTAAAYKGGTGDHGSRWVTQSSLDSGAYKFARGLGLVTGKTKTNSKGATLYEVLPPVRGGATVAGWGYGLMQHDYVWNAPFIESGAALDAAQNILRGAQKLASSIKFFTNKGYNGDDILSAALAAYNAGDGVILKKLQADADVDDATTGKDYSAWTMKVASNLMNAFAAQPQANA